MGQSPSPSPQVVYKGEDADESDSDNKGSQESGEYSDYGEDEAETVRFVSHDELNVLKKSIEETNRTNEALRTMITDTNSQFLSFKETIGVNFTWDKYKYDWSIQE